MDQAFLYFGSAFILSAGITPLIRLLAIKNQWIAKPKADRWHKRPTALMGGIAIFLAIVLPLVYISDITSLFHHTIPTIDSLGTPSIGAAILIGSVFLFFLGLYDDLRSIKPHNKLIAQIIVASMVVFLGFRIQWFASQTLDTMATLFWIVGLTNAFNLIDNMDGLCAGVGVVASLSLALLFYPLAHESLLVAMILAGAMGGFLIYNFNPAKIFMGDCGSLVIGFSVSVLSLQYSQVSSVYPPPALARFAVPILILLVPILDTTLVTFIRLLSGRKASTGGRDHTSHRLVLIGFSEKKAVLYLYGVGAISGLAAVFVSRSDAWTTPAVIIPVILSILLMGIYLSQLRVYPEREFSVLRNRSFTPVLMELTYKRQILLVMLDLVILSFSYYLSYRLRFGGMEFPFYFKLFLQSMPAVIACKMLAFYCMGIYRGFWGFLSTSDVSLYVRASLVGTVASVAAVTFIYRFNDFSKGIFIIDYLLATSLMLGARGSFRLFQESQKRKTLSGEKVIIYGAGRAGELLLREIINNKHLGVVPVGFVDDDNLKKGKKIQGIPILGAFNDIEHIHEHYPFNGLLVSFSNGNGHNQPAHEAAKKYCHANGLSLKRFRIDLQDVDLTSIK